MHLDCAITKVLHRRQRYLRTLHWDFGPLGATAPISLGIDTSAIRSLHIFVDALVGLKSAHACLRDLLELETLGIFADLREYCRSTGLDYRNDIQRGKASEDIVATLFQDDPEPTDSKDTTPGCSDGAFRVPVRILRLKGFHFHLTTANRIIDAISAPDLTALSITDCERELMLLGALAGSGGKCEHLRHLELIQAWPQPPEQGMSINDFLTSFDTLETLVISAPKTETLEPSLQAVASHGKLRSLYLDCQSAPTGSSATSCYPAKDVTEESTKCKLLEQLAVDFPSVIHDTDFAKDSGTLSYAVGSMTVEVFAHPTNLT